MVTRTLVSMLSMVTGSHGLLRSEPSAFTSRVRAMSSVPTGFPLPEPKSTMVIVPYLAILILLVIRQVMSRRSEVVSSTALPMAIAAKAGAMN